LFVKQKEVGVEPEVSEVHIPLFVPGLSSLFCGVRIAAKNCFSIGCLLSLLTATEAHEGIGRAEHAIVTGLGLLA
jgi:hypothetical protein